MSIRTLNGLGNAININTISAGEAIKLSDNSTNQSVNVDIRKQTSKTSISDDDVFLLQEADGTIHKITGAHLKSEAEQTTAISPLEITGNAISIKGLTGFTAIKY